jgi:hypothetical protein
MGKINQWFILNVCRLNMELAMIFTKIKKDVMASTLLTNPDKLKVLHILKSSFKYCVNVENKEYDYPSGTVFKDQKESFNDIFGELFNK